MQVRGIKPVKVKHQIKQASKRQPFKHQGGRVGHSGIVLPSKHLDTSELIPFCFFVVVVVVVVAVVAVVFVFPSRTGPL
jgi:hypothetical protein